MSDRAPRFSSSFARTLMLGVALPAFAFAAPAYAQDAEADSGNAIDALTAEIVVTATKKANVENVQDVALAVTAYGAESLDALKVRDVSSLSFSVPNVSLDQIGTSRGTANFSIRGLGINSSIPSIDPTVGTFVDGVYLGVNQGVVFDTFDLDSVEIVRGPQGILFGRNTTGGAVLLNTGNPTDDWRFKFKGAAEGPVDNGRGAMNMFVQGTVSGPIIEDVLSFKLGAYYNSDGGYFKNLFNNGNFGKAETVILRGGLTLKASDTLTITAKGEYFDSKGDGANGQNHGIFSRDSFDLSIDEEGFYDSRANFATVRADWELGSGTITNIFGYRDYRGKTRNDIDATPRFLFHSDTDFSQEQYSNELRYAASYGALDLTVGSFVFHQKLAYSEDRLLPTVSPLKSYGGGAQDHDVLGLFAQGDYDLTDALTLTAGIRWSREEKAAEITYVRPRPACSVVAGTCPITGKNPFIPAENNGFSEDQSWSNWTPKLGLQYRFTDDAQVYGSWTRGFRSGGYNFRITAPLAFEAISAANGAFAFDEEKVDSYEVGFKFQSSDRRLTLNGAAYITDIANMQREVNQSSATSGVAQSIFNTADAGIWGAELEGKFAITGNLLLSGNVGYINAEYDRVLFDISGNGTIGAEDLALKLPRVPEWTWGFGLLHDLELGEGSLVTRINFQHRNAYAYTDNNFGFITASDQLEGSLTWNTPLEGVSLSLYGKNLLDEVQHGGDTQVPFGGALSDGNNRPFDDRPAAGTFSPISKGRVIGLEVTIAM